jgi:hypothetical protein
MFQGVLCEAHRYEAVPSRFQRSNVDKVGKIRTTEPGCPTRNHLHSARHCIGFKHNFIE